MRLVIAIFLVAMVAVGCRKSEDVKPTAKTSTTTTTDNTSKGGTSTTPPDTTPKLTHDDSIHMAAFKIPGQTVTTSVSGTNLILTYTENAALLFTAEGYQKNIGSSFNRWFSKYTSYRFRFYNRCRRW